MCYGEFEGWFEVKELGIRIRFRPGDIIFICGSALHHKAGEWTGNGRFVIVPFSDCHLFAAQHVKRPTTSPPLYGSSWAKSHAAYLYKDVPKK